MKKFAVLLLGILLVFAAHLHASIFGVVHGLIHDPEHRPVAGAEVILRAKNSDWSQTVNSNALGEFRFLAVPLGQYSLNVSVSGFSPEERVVSVLSGNAVDVHFALAVARVNEKIEVSGEATQVDTQSATPTTTLNRTQISTTPGADRTNSLAMITDYVPSASWCTISCTFAADTRSVGCWTASLFRIQILPVTSDRNSIPRTLTKLKCNVAATQLNMATVLTASSMSLLVLDLSATTRRAGSQLWKLQRHRGSAQLRQP